MVRVRSDSTIHSAVQGFAEVSTIYEQGRPDYPDQIIDEIVGKVGPTEITLDVGAGTGKLTRRLSPKRRVVAIDPVPAMLSVLSATSPDAEGVVSIAEALPIAPRSVGAVVVGQAFHWFDGERALAEFARVLQPPGTLLMVWNERRHREPPHRLINHLLLPYRSNAPGYRSGRWRHAFRSATCPFARPTLSAVRWRRRVDLETFRARYMSVSVIASLDPGTQREIDERLVEIFEGVANGVGTIDLPYETHLWATQLVTWRDPGTDGVTR